MRSVHGRVKGLSGVERAVAGREVQGRGDFQLLIAGVLKGLDIAAGRPTVAGTRRVGGRQIIALEIQRETLLPLDDVLKMLLRSVRQKQLFSQIVTITSLEKKILRNELYCTTMSKNCLLKISLRKSLLRALDFP